jgi:hypothetical protein
MKKTAVLLMAILAGNSYGFGGGGHGSGGHASAHASAHASPHVAVSEAHVSSAHPAVESKASTMRANPVVVGHASQSDDKKKKE